MPLPLAQCQTIVRVTVWSLQSNFVWVVYKQAPCPASFLTLPGMVLTRLLYSLSSLNVSNVLQGCMTA